MKNLKLLLCIGTLALALANPVTAQKGCDPGQILTPCSSSQPTSESTDPGQMLTPPAADSVDVVSVAEAALTALLIF